MNNEIKEVQIYDRFNEVYEVVRTLEVVTRDGFNGCEGQSTVRVEVLCCRKTETYIARWFILTHFHLQPSYPRTDKGFTQKTGDFDIWVPLADMPWVDEKDEDQAARRALLWLKDRGA